MEKRIFIWLFGGLLLVACNNSGGGSTAQGKGDEGLGGGSVDAQAVQVLVDEVVRKVENMPTVFPEVNVQDLRQVANRVEIIGRKQTFANGVETNATNDGEKRIEVNMTRWARLRDQNKKLALIFHEMLGILKLEKNNYSISSRFLFEKRFAAQRTYQCHDQSGTACQIEIGYDSSQRNFQILDHGCGGFKNLKFSQYQAFYSSTSSCPYNDDVISEEPQAMSCMSSYGPGNFWSELYFHDGLAFHFEGIESDRLDCQL